MAQYRSRFRGPWYIYWIVMTPALFSVLFPGGFLSRAGLCIYILFLACCLPPAACRLPVLHKKTVIGNVLPFLVFKL
jgi:hypothetical protein